MLLTAGPSPAPVPSMAREVFCPVLSPYDLLLSPARLSRASRPEELVLKRSDPVSAPHALNLPPEVAKPT
jgi:hypothetical protein